MVQVVGVLRQEQYNWYVDYEYLVGRHSGETYHGRWEFPGGKVNSDENPEEALVRKWLEGLGVTITVKDEFFNGQFTTPDLTDFQVRAYRITTPSFVFAPTAIPAHSEFQWMSRATILSLPDNECTPGLKPITQSLPMSEHELIQRAAKCIEVVRARARRLSTTTIEREALALMPEGKLEAALLAIPE